MSVKLLAGERQPNERDNHVMACNDWLNLGEGRSLSVLIDRYQLIPIDTNKPPTLSRQTLKQWSAKFDWPSRAAIFDADFQSRKDAIAEKKREEILNHPLANNYGRIEALINLFDQHQAELKDGIYSIETSIDKNGIEHERDVYSRDMITHFRGLLKDLAEETGGRIKKQEITGKDGGPVKVNAINFNLGDDD